MEVDAAVTENEEKPREEKEEKEESEEKEPARKRRKPARVKAGLGEGCSHLVPYLARADGTLKVLLGFRRSGPCVRTWTAAASYVDSHAMPGMAATATPSPLELAARAGHAAYMGMLGTAKQLEAALNTDARVRVPDGYAYLVRLEPHAECVVDMYNNLARYMSAAFTKDADKSLLNCPAALLAFTRLRWVPLEHLASRVTLAGASVAVRARVGGPALRLTLEPRTIELLRHVLPALEGIRAASAP